MHRSLLAEEGVDHNRAVVADRTLAEGLAHNLAAAVADHILVEEVDRIPDEAEGAVAGHIHQAPHTAPGVGLHIGLAVRHGGDPVHLGYRRKDR